MKKFRLVPKSFLIMILAIAMALCFVSLPAMAATPDPLAVTTADPDAPSQSASTLSSPSALLTAGDSLFDGGAGTKASPYLVGSVETLKKLADSVNGGASYAGVYIALSANLDLSGAAWTAIGDGTSHPFGGNFDGNGYTISNLTIGSAQTPATTVYAGLFGYADSGACFRHITLTNVSIYLSTTETSYAGAIVAAMKNDSSGSTISVLDHCRAEGAINVVTADKSAMVGGLVGMSNQYAAVTNCGADVDVSLSTGSGVGNLGGLVGFASIKLLAMNNYALGTVSQTATNTNANAGGLFGTANGICYNNYAANSVTGVRAGGLAGNLASASAVLGSWYLQAPAYGTSSGNSDSATVLQRTASELSNAEFAGLLRTNLSASALETAKTKVAAAGVSGCGDLDALIARVEGKFYDWQLQSGQVVHGSTYYGSAAVDATIFAGGKGTAAEPFLIGNESQLRAFATSLSAELDYNGVAIALANDIALSNNEWTPVGEGEYTFNGSFDGRNHSISGLTIGSAANPHTDGKGTTMFYGFFGVLDANAEVRNLALSVDIHVSGELSLYVAGLAGYISQSLVDNVTVSGTVVGTTSHNSANVFAGGLGGMVYKQKIINSSSVAAVRAESVGGIAEAGGIAGLQNRGLIANSYSGGEITGNADRKAEGAPALGGLVGVQAGTIVNCYSLASVVADCYTGYVGALAGWATGIADSFQSYYSTSALLVTDNLTANRLVISPAVAIGWSVGPGFDDEGGPYTGSVSLHLKGLSAADMKGQVLTDQLNTNFAKLNVDLVAGGRQQGHWSGSTALATALKTWSVDAARSLPVIQSNGSATASYDPQTAADIAALLPTETPAYHQGSFYGRDDAKTLTVKVTIGNDSDITAIEVVTGSNGYADLIAALVAGTKSVNDLADSAFKSALSVALAKAEVPDYSAYGTATDNLFAGGKGTQSDPWRIANEEQLINFARSLNEDESYEGKYIALTKDITLTKAWTPAGSGNPWPFAGYFDGNGHTVSGMTIGSADAPYSGPYAGLFAYIKGGTVVDLTLADYHITMADSGSKRIYAGGLAAAMDQTGATGYLDNVRVSGEISLHSNSGAAYAGGLLAQSIRGTVTNCVADVTINAVSDSAWVYGGGLVAMPARSGQLNSYAEGAITASGPVNKVAIGGLSAFQAGVVYNCYGAVDLNATSSTGDIGGLAGRNTGIALILNSYYDTKALQKNGGTTLTETKAVGTIVAGDRDGAGAVAGVDGLADLTGAAFAATLNANLADTESLDRVKSLLQTNWSSPLNEAITFSSWITKAGRNVTFGTPEVELPFTDVENHWGLEAIRTVYAKGLMVGEAKTMFNPDGRLNRAMLVTILYRLEGQPAVSFANPFDDADSAAWYGDAVLWAAQNNIVQGYGKGKFGPADDCSREQIAVILMRYAQYKQYDTSKTGDISGFKDKDQISSYALTALTWAHAEGMIQGRTATRLVPGGEATRAEVATILTRFLANIAK